MVLWCCLLGDRKGIQPAKTLSQQRRKVYFGGPSLTWNNCIKIGQINKKSVVVVVVVVVSVILMLFFDVCIAKDCIVILCAGYVFANAGWLSVAVTIGRPGSWTRQNLLLVTTIQSTVAFLYRLLLLVPCFECWKYVHLKWRICLLSPRKKEVMVFGSVCLSVRLP